MKFLVCTHKHSPFRKTRNGAIAALSAARVSILCCQGRPLRWRQGYIKRALEYNSKTLFTTAQQSFANISIVSYARILSSIRLNNGNYFTNSSMSKVYPIISPTSLHFPLTVIVSPVDISITAAFCSSFFK